MHSPYLNISIQGFSCDAWKPCMFCPVLSSFTEESNFNASDPSGREGEISSPCLKVKSTWLCSFKKTSTVKGYLKWFTWGGLQASWAWVWTFYHILQWLLGPFTLAQPKTDALMGAVMVPAFEWQAPSQKPVCQQEIPEDYTWWKFTTRIVCPVFNDISLLLHWIGKKISKHLLGDCSFARC